MKDSWPKVDDLVKLYWSAGFIDPGNLTSEQKATLFQEPMDAARRQFEKSSRWIPFLSVPTQVQWLNLVGNPTSGSYTVFYGTTETIQISSFTASALQSALSTIVGAGKVTVMGADTGPFTITLNASLSPYSKIMAGSNLLSGGSAPAIIVGESPVWHDVTGPKVLQLKTGYVEISGVFGNAYSGNLGTFLDPTNSYQTQHFQDDLDAPIDRLEATMSTWGMNWVAYGQGINVVGRRGYSDQVPDDVWMAVLRYAAKGSLSVVSAAKTGGVVEWRKGDVSEKYGVSGAYSGLGDDWERKANCTAMSYRRLRSA